MAYFESVVSGMFFKRAQVKWSEQEWAFQKTTKRSSLVHCRVMCERVDLKANSCKDQGVKNLSGNS